MIAVALFAISISLSFTELAVDVNRLLNVTVFLGSWRPVVLVAMLGTMKDPAWVSPEVLTDRAFCWSFPVIVNAGDEDLGWPWLDVVVVVV